MEILIDILNHPRPRHVLVEKLLCTTVARCREASSSSLSKLRLAEGLDAARKMPDMLVEVGLEYRYMPPVAKLIEVVKGGSLGTIKMLAIREHGFPFLAQIPDIIDNAYVNGSRGMLDLCMFAEGSRNEQEIAVVWRYWKGEAFVPESIVRVGTREGRRQGVQTLKAYDNRIKMLAQRGLYANGYDGLRHGSSYLEHLNFLYAVKLDGTRALSVDLPDGLISVATGVAAQLSIELGRFVTMAEVVN